MKRALILGWICFVAGFSPVSAHLVEQLALGTDQIINGIADDRIVLWETWPLDGQSQTTELYDYVGGERRTLETESSDTTINARGDLLFARLKKIYRYAGDQIIDLPWEGSASRAVMNGAGDVAWAGADPSGPSSEAFLYEATSGTVRNVSNTPTMNESKVLIAENGDVAWQGSAGLEYTASIFDRSADEVVEIARRAHPNRVAVEDVNGHGDVLWVENAYLSTPRWYVYRQATAQSEFVAEGRLRQPRLSDKGDVSYLGGSSSAERNVFLYQGATGTTIALTDSGYQWEPDINARGDVTWYGGYPDRHSGWDIFFYDSATGEIEQLTTDGLSGILHYYPQVNAHGDVTWIQHDWDYRARTYLARNIVPVEVDILPGSADNCFRHDGRGVIPVAILGGPDLDVRGIATASVKLESLSVKLVGGEPLVAYEDVDRDGIEDLVAQIADGEGVFEGGQESARVFALRSDGALLGGSDAVCVLGVDTVVWAVSAIASSEYTTEEWSAQQATGEPDTHACGDLTTAWAPLPNGTDPEWLEVDFGTELRVKGLRVHETYEAGFITRIDLIDGSGSSRTVWTGTDTTACPGWFELELSPPAARAKAVKIYTQIDGWEEIDAVGLVLAPGQ